MITLLLLIPLIGSLILLPIQSNSLKNEVKMKKIALSTSLINLFISILLWIQFDTNTNQFQFVQEQYEVNTYDFYLGVDGLSIYFVLLTTIIMPIAIISN